MGVVALDIDCVKYCLLHISHLQHQIFDGQIWPNAEQSFLLLANAFKKNESFQNFLKCFHPWTFYDTYQLGHLQTHQFARYHISPCKYHLSQCRYHLSPCRYHLSQCRYHLTPGTYHLPPGRYHLSPGRYHLSPGRYHLSPVRYHLSPGRYHLSPCRCHISLR